MSAVTCSWINSVNWQEGYPEDFILSGAVHVWGAQISEQMRNLGYFTELLYQTELERASRYYHQKDKDRFIISRGILRHLLGKYSDRLPANLRFDTGSNKKPFLKNDNDNGLYFNVTHSGNWILIAIADRETGIDMEKINPDFNYEEIVELIFTHPEIQHIRDSAPPPGSFYKLWTRKEALAKALGLGLTDDLKIYPSLDGTHDFELPGSSLNNDWSVISFGLDESYVVSMANDPSIEMLRFTEFLRLL
jgi:4'-phosphopantetheinyl transferase